jgi:Domain of unknown function (DUF4397)
MKTPLSLTKALYSARGKFNLEVNMKKLNMGRIGLLLLVSSLGLAACTPPVPEVVNTQVRFVNAATGSTNLNIYFGEDKKNGTAVNPYKAVFPGADSYTVVPSGTLKYSLCIDDLKTCSNDNLTIETVKDKPKTVFLVGTKDTADDTGTTPRPLEVISFVDEPGVPASGNAKFRVIHVATSTIANEVKFHFTGPDEGLQITPPALKYKEAYSYTEVPAKDYRLRVTIAGTPDPVLDTGKITFVAGKVYTLVIFNPELNKGGISVLTDR